MSDDAAHARVERMIDQIKPFVDQLAEAARQTYTKVAKLAGDPVTSENVDFWRIAGNFFVANTKLNPTGPAIVDLVNLSKAIAISSRYRDWMGSVAICQALFDDLDGGETLGLSEEFFIDDWNDPEQRASALTRGMQYHRVPKAFHSAVADAVTAIMLESPGAWNFEGTQLSQPWAMACTYVIYALALRVKAADPD